MNILSKRLSFLPSGLHEKFHYVVGEKKYRVKRCGVKTLNLLREMAQLANLGRPGWALRIRRKARKVIELGRTSLLVYVVSTCNDPMTQALAIWLRGRMEGHLGIKILADLKDSPHDIVRKELAKTLSKKADWATLRWMAQCDRVPKIRRIAKPRLSRPIGDRVKRFCENTKVSKAKKPIAEQEFVSNVPIPVETNHPAKTRSYIAEILFRINQWVSGGKGKGG